MDLTAFYQDLLDEWPNIGDIQAIAAGINRCGRQFDSPTIPDHRAALTYARQEKDRTSGPPCVCRCTAGAHDESGMCWTDGCGCEGYRPTLTEWEG